MAIADSKKWRIHFDANLPPIDATAVSGYKNTVSTHEVESFGNPGGLETYRFVHIVGDTVPDNTDYPDTVAPIGSKFTRLIITAGVVTGAAEYMKTAAATWTIIGSVT